jgi:hypothetical protein
MPTVESALTANAILSKLAFSDTFTRVFGPGLGGSWVFSDWDSRYSVPTYASVDGSVAVFTMDTYESYSGLPVPLRGALFFDFLVPLSFTRYDPDYRVYLDSYHDGGVYLQPRGIVEGVDWTLEIGGNNSYNFTPTPGQWYRIHAAWDENTMAANVWLRTDPEPAGWQITESPSHIDLANIPSSWRWPNGILDVYYSPIEEDAKFDNFMVFAYTTASFGRGTFSAGAIRSRPMPTRTATMDAEFCPRHFTVGAWLSGGRSGHSRLWDHYGTEPDTVVVLDGAIGPYPSGTTVHVVLTDLVNRIVALESGYHVTGAFTMGAWIALTFSAAAVLHRVQQDNNIRVIYVNAEIIRGKTNQPISVDALIVKPTAGEFTAAAYLIDLVC